MRRDESLRFRPSLEALEDRIVPQATRTWVSGVGDDVNPCSRTAPGKTFAGAISKTATGGVISVLDPGGYGALTITKAITIDGGGFPASVIVTSGSGFTVNAAATDVVIIRGISFYGNVGSGSSTTALDGIRVNGAAAVIVEDCVIENFGGFGINFQPAAGGKLFVTNTVIRNNSGGGIYVHPGAAGSATAAVDHTTLENNLFGLRADDRSVVSVSDSTVAGNTNQGFFAFSASQLAEIDLQNNVIANNGVPTQAAGANAIVKAADDPSGSLAHSAGSPTSTTLRVKRAGRLAVLVAAVSGGAGVAAGEVLLLDGDRVLGIVSLENGVAMLSVRLKPG